MRWAGGAYYCKLVQLPMAGRVPQAQCEHKKTRRRGIRRVSLTGCAEFGKYGELSLSSKPHSPSVLVLSVAIIVDYRANL